MQGEEEVMSRFPPRWIPRWVADSRRDFARLLAMPREDIYSRPPPLDVEYFYIERLINDRPNTTHWTAA